MMPTPAIPHMVDVVTVTRKLVDADSPRADEILFALVMTTGARVHARVGGLKAADIKGEDGLR